MCVHMYVGARVFGIDKVLVEQRNTTGRRRRPPRARRAGRGRAITLLVESLLRADARRIKVQLYTPWKARF